MKTRNTILTAVMVLFASALAFAKDPGNPKLVVINQKSGVYKVIYEGAKTGKVSLKIYDKDNREVFAETSNEGNGFIRPVNFDGMDAGVYTIEVTDASGKHSQKVTYGAVSTVKAVHVARTSTDGKYLLAVASTGAQLINVKIFDGSNNLVHNESFNINGDFGMIYDLNKVTGTPTFEVSDATGFVVSK